MGLQNVKNIVKKLCKSTKKGIENIIVNGYLSENMQQIGYR